jgi:hypothetical protein
MFRSAFAPVINGRPVHTKERCHLGPETGGQSFQTEGDSEGRAPQKMPWALGAPHSNKPPGALLWASLLPRDRKAEHRRPTVGLAEVLCLQRRHLPPC